MRFLCFLLVLALTMLTVSGCGSGDSPTAPGDSTNPTVVGISPDNNAVRVPTHTTVTITFSEAMETASITPQAITFSHGVVFTISVSSDGKSVTLTPKDPLDFSTTYTITLSTGVRDRGGNPLTGQTSFAFTTQANTWLKTYDVGNSIGGTAIQAGNGRIIVACGRVAMLDSLGNQIWERTDLSAVDIVRSSTGSGYVALINPNSPMDFGLPSELVGLDEAGTITWRTVISNPATSQPLTLAGDNGYFVLFTSNDCGCSWIQKYGVGGQLLWQQQYVGYEKFYGQSVEVISGGDLLIGGVTTIQSYGTAKYAAQLEPTTGSILWDMDYTSYTALSVYQVCTDLSGAILLVGVEVPSVGSPRANFERRDRADPTRMFNKVYTFSGGSLATDVLQTADAGYILLGDASVGTNRRLFLLKTDAAGNEQWRKIIDGDGMPQHVRAHSMLKTSDGGFIVIGTHEINSTSIGLSIIKTDEQGYY